MYVQERFRCCGKILMAEIDEHVIESEVYIPIYMYVCMYTSIVSIYLCIY